MASFYTILLWLVLVQLPILTFAQTNKNVTLGSSLSTLDQNPSWNSPSGDFSFGFLPTTQAQNLFLLSIWFAKIPEKTIVWTANGGKPVQRGSKVQLTSEGVLSLSSPNGTQIWKPDQLMSGEVASTAMLDSGNFVLTSNGFNTLWSSFEDPTDTLLPTQILYRGGILTSRFTDDNYKEGRFRLSLQDDRNLVMYPLDRPTDNNYAAYWQSSDTVGTNGGTQHVFNQSGYLYLALLDAGTSIFRSDIPVSTRDSYLRVTLDYDGALRLYTYPKSSVRPQLWSLTWSEPGNICLTDFKGLGSGVCGYNSLCKLQDQKATCKCPPGYIYNDQNYKFGGCKQSFVPPNCEAEVGVGYEMKQILNTDWIYGDYEHFKSQTEDWCGERCLNDCLCAAAISREGNCWLKRFPLSNGQSDKKGKALIKVGNSSAVLGLPPPFVKTIIEKDNWRKRGFFLLGSLAFLSLILLLMIPLYIYWPYSKKQVTTSSDACALGVNLRSFTYKELDEATGGFKEEIGQGAYSTVFKGSLQSATISFVAVKRLDKKVREGEGEFKAEMSAISLTNHKNLVKLLGFCDEGTNRLLVYEYMRNGTLADFLFGSSKPEWSLRIQISFGIARGLAYLHEDCSAPIIHCDVKPQNILLDDTFMPKISDFGLAKLLKGDQTRTYTGIRGTKGYLAPEWFKNVAITAKVDVYSFGIMLLEIICCRKNVVTEVGSEELDILADWAYECCMENKFRHLVQNDEDAKKDRRLERLVMVAIWSIQDDPSLRPSMKKGDPNARRIC